MSDYFEVSTVEKKSFLSNQDLIYFSKFIVGLKIFADYFIILLLSILVARLNILVIKINFFKLNAIKF
jgi:hypothetical protein